MLQKKKEEHEVIMKTSYKESEGANELSFALKLWAKAAVQ